MNASTLSLGTTTDPNSYVSVSAETYAPRSIKESIFSSFAFTHSQAAARPVAGISEEVRSSHVTLKMEGQPDQWRSASMATYVAYKPVKNQSSMKIQCTVQDPTEPAHDASWLREKHFEFGDHQQKMPAASESGCTFTRHLDFKPPPRAPATSHISHLPPGKSYM